MQKSIFPLHFPKFFTLVLIFLSHNSFALISTPNQASPNDNDTGRSTSSSFYINGISSLADEIILEYSESITMSSPKLIVKERLNTGAFMYVSKLKLNTDYYWRVKARSSTDSSNWSSIRKFTTTAIFRTYQPGTNVDDLRASFVNFRAYRVFDYDTILWEIDTTINFNSSLLRRVEVPDTGSSLEVSTLQKDFFYNQKYYWRAKAYSGSNISAWTPTLYFVTGDTIGIRYPTPAWLHHVATEVEWSTWREDEPVQIQLDTSLSFSSPFLDTFLSGGVHPYPDPRYKLTELLYETKFFFRARSYNAADTTPWSNSSFTTNGLATDVVIAPNYADPTFVYYNRTSIDGSTGYQLLLDTSENFDSPIVKSTFSSDGRDTAVDLFFDQIYYTKARPYHAKDTGKWTRTRPITIFSSPGTYYPFSNWTDVGIYDSVQYGTSPGIDGYQIQISAGTNYDTTLLLDTAVTGDKPNSSQNFIKGLTFKYNTRYRWHIRGWHSKDTSPWSGDRFFTTITSPKLTRPFNSDFLGDQAALDLQWESLGNNVRYQVLLDTTPLFSSPLLVDSIVESNVLAQKDLLFRPLYYWKVRIVTDDDTSDWSETWKFTVLQPRLNSPGNNRTNISVEISSLDWNSITGTNGYVLQLDSFSDFRSPEEFSDTVKKSFFHYFLDKPDILTFNTKYYWRVKLYHSKDTSDWSTVWNFTTLPRRAPVKLSPVDSAEDVAVFATLTWEAYSGANSYAIEYAKNLSFDAATKTTSASTSVKIPLEPSTRYYWRVRGRNTDGNEFYDWSEEWTFVTDIGIPAVTLISPANNAIDQSQDIKLSWSKNNDATSYQIELSSDTTFLGVRINYETTTSTTFANLSYGKTYYWRVKTISSSLSSPWSEVWSFKIENKPNSITQNTQDGVTIYPNPSAKYITISGMNGSAKTIQIFDNLGQLVKSIHTEFNEEDTILVSDLDSGVYYIVLDKDDFMVRKSLIISH